MKRERLPIIVAKLFLFVSTICSGCGGGGGTEQRSDGFPTNSEIDNMTDEELYEWGFISEQELEKAQRKRSERN